jgi:hypothetical protein
VHKQQHKVECDLERTLRLLSIYFATFPWLEKVVKINEILSRARQEDSL